MSDDPAKVSRRDVLKISGGAALLPLVSTLGTAAPFQPAGAAGTEVAQLKALDGPQARLLQSVSRTLFPHDFLGGDQYLKVVLAIDSKAAADPGIARMLRDALDAFPADFTAMQETAREDYLRSIEKSQFFGLAYQETITGLYADLAVSRALGYQGSSVEHGGYINRGFDDINWLPPAVPAGK
ncbi:MAG: gluconate 2-dehydrogenase subunit 3 family protein [Gammaproteobacteria bacterium]|nr:gluconate 2-dehydrogenase subunit 3 family protein [Gammaproteobacteria bacterium]